MIAKCIYTVELEASNAVPTTIILLIRAAFLMFLEMSKKFMNWQPSFAPEGPVQSVDIAPVSGEVCCEAVDLNDEEFIFVT